MTTQALVLHPADAFLLDLEELAVESVTLALGLAHLLLLLLQIVCWNGGQVAFKSIFQQFLLSLRFGYLESMAQRLWRIVLSSHRLQGVNESVARLGGGLS